MLTLIVLLIALALVFDFINGFHDAANSIASIIATKVLKPWQALLWGALFNFIAFFIFPLHVAMTMSTGIIEPQYFNNTAIAAALLGAIFFNLSTWWLKLPSSSSHALIGALIGIGIMQGGLGSIYWDTIGIVVAFVFIAPVLGMMVAYFLILWVPRVHLQDQKIKFYKVLQLFSSALVSMGHGGNDAQKTMGIIFLLLHTNGYLQTDASIPIWVVLMCYGVISLGTLVGGWRIIETVGYKITALKPPSGACAEFGAACVLFIANHFGIPISTTHAVTGAIVGVSAYNKNQFASTNWKIVRRIFIAWLITFPAAALLSCGVYIILEFFA